MVSVATAKIWHTRGQLTNQMLFYAEVNYIHTYFIYSTFLLNLFSSLLILVYASLFAKMWYSELLSYNYKKPVFSSKTGHFTQLICNFYFIFLVIFDKLSIIAAIYKGKGTTQLGCGLAISTLVYWLI